MRTVGPDPLPKIESRMLTQNVPGPENGGGTVPLPLQRQPVQEPPRGLALRQVDAATNRPLRQRARTPYWLPDRSRTPALFETAQSVQHA
jgi:hypothetical protein